MLQLGNGQWFNLFLPNSSGVDPHPDYRGFEPHPAIKLDFLSKKDYKNTPSDALQSDKTLIKDSFETHEAKQTHFAKKHLPHSTQNGGLSQDHARAVSCRHLNHHEGRATHRAIALEAAPRFRWRPSNGAIRTSTTGFVVGSQHLRRGKYLNKHEQA